jgi:hypothetical protein
MVDLFMLTNLSNGEELAPDTLGTRLPIEIKLKSVFLKITTSSELCHCQLAVAFAFGFGWLFLARRVCAVGPDRCIKAFYELAVFIRYVMPMLPRMKTPGAWMIRTCAHLENGSNWSQEGHKACF